MYQFFQQHPRLTHLLDVIGSLILINLLGVLAAIPLLTLPPALAAVFAATARLARGEGADLLKDFGEAFRHLFFKSWLVVLANVFIGLAVLANLRLVQSGQIPLGGLIGGVSIVVGTLWLLVNLYLWPLLVMLDQPLGRVLALAARLAFGHLPWSLVLGVLATLAVLAALAVPLLLALCGFAAIALLINWGTWRVIRRYLHASQDTPGVDG